MTIVILVIGISLLIFIHELGHFLAAKAFGLYVEEFGFGFPPRIFSVKRGETRYSVNLLPFGGFVKIFGERSDISLTGSEAGAVPPARSFAHQNALRRAVIVGAGVVMNVLLGWILLSVIFMVGAEGNVVVTSISPDSPAAAAGLLPGDRLLDFKVSKDFIALVDESRGRELTLRVERGDKTLEIKATPDTTPPKDRGALGVGINESGIPKLGFFAALGEGFKTTYQILWAILKSLGALLVGIFTGGEVLKNFVGPVGIVQVAGETAKVGLIYLWQLIALISLNLAVLNVLPFPALDGGRLFFIVIEKMKGSPISPKREMIANAIGFGLLILLMAVLTVRDVARLF